MKKNETYKLVKNIYVCQINHSNCALLHSDL